MSAPRLISTPEHVVSIVVGGCEIVGPEAYEITVSMVDPCCKFAMRWPFDRRIWDLCRKDSPVKVLIDGTKVLSGLIDERFVPDDDNDTVNITGRDLAGRVFDESCPDFDYEGMTMRQVITKALDPWFKTLTFNNAFNRRVARGRGSKAKAWKEPVTLFAEKKLGTRIEPGQTRREVIEKLCSQAGCLAFASSDGSEYFVGLPNYDQQPQFRLFKPAADSIREDEASVHGMGVHDTIAERYSRIIVVGTGTGTDADYGDQVSSKYGEAKNNEDTEDGEGKDFTLPKRLIIRRSPQNGEEADDLAEREMAKRDGHGFWVTARAPGHGQLIQGAFVTLFTPDTIADVEDERTGTKGPFLITECVYRSSRQGAEETSLHLVPKGTVLA